MTKPDADDLIRYALAVTGACSSHHPDDVIGVMDDVLDHVVQQAKIEERDVIIAYGARVRPTDDDPSLAGFLFRVASNRHKSGEVKP